MTHYRWVAVAGLLAVLNACEEPPSAATEPGPSLGLLSVADQVRNVELDAARAGRTERGPEDEILRLESTVPGIGGVYLDERTKKFTVYVKDQASDEAARTEVMRVANRARADLGAQVVDDSEVLVRRGEFSFSELLSFKSALTGRLLALDGFVSIDADERENRVRVVVESERDMVLAQERILMSRLPADAFIIELGFRGGPLSTLRSRFRATGAGIQINGFANQDCTHGWTVSTSQGDWGLLTAGHCTPPADAGNTGEAFYQPTTTPADFIGSISMNQPWNLTSCVDPSTGQYFNGPCTRADAAFISYSGAAKRIARTSYVSSNNTKGTLNFHSWWSSIGSVPAPWVGMYVDKIGRTTGWTRGTLAQTCVDVVLDYGAGVGDVLFLCAGRVDNAAMGRGDSGAPVFKGYSGFPIRPMGILFATGAPLNVEDDEGDYCTTNCRYYLANWSQINYHLGRYFNAAPAPPLTATIGGPNEVPEDEYCTWQGFGNGGTPPYSYSWSGVLSGSGMNKSGTVNSSGWLYLTVTDAAAATANTQLYVTVDENAGACLEE